MHEGYAMITGAMSMDGFLKFSGISIADGAYIKQEVQRMKKN